MTIARLADGAVVEIRDLANLDSIPEHKRGAWRSVTGDPPAYDPRVQQIVGPAYTITEHAVERTWTVQARSRPDQIAAVKAEAQRRITAAVGAEGFEACMIRQLNATMRAIELTDKRATGAELSPAEQVEDAALRQLAADIKRIRARSNEIEAMDPVPADFAADGRWA